MPSQTAPAEVEKLSSAIEENFKLFAAKALTHAKDQSETIEIFH